MIRDRSDRGAAAPGRARRGGSSRRSTMTPSFDSKPSISTRSCVERLLSLVVTAAQAAATVATDGVDLVDEDDAGRVGFLPCSNRSRTRLAPTPTNISTKSLPEMLKNGTAASPAIARASRVLPVPGAPMSSTPLGMRPPRRWNFFGSFRNAMISSQSSLASSMPATSAKVTLFCASLSSRAFDLPKLIALPPEACSCRMKKKKMNNRTTIGSQVIRMLVHSPF